MLYRRDRFIIQNSFWAGGVIAYPTEAVWGLGCDPNNSDAVQRLLAIKNRPVTKGVILITGDLSCVQPMLESFPMDMQQRALNFWPGHTTLLIPDSYRQIPDYIRGQHDTVAIRVSNHPFVRWFSRTVAPFIVSTSANRAGEPPCRFSWQVKRQLGGQLDYVVPGRTLGVKNPSQIIRLTSGDVVRSV